jgi:hypothetical protein
MLVRFGRCCRIEPFVFSFVPRSHESCGAVKYIRVRVARSTAW